MSALQFALSVNNGQETKTFQESVAGPFVVDGKFSKRSPVKRREVFSCVREAAQPATRMRSNNPNARGGKN